MIGLFVGTLLASLSGFVSLLPEGGKQRLARIVAWVVFRGFGYRRQVLSENLSASFPELDDAARTALQRRVEVHLAETLLEFLRLPRTAAAGFGNIEIVGLEHLERAFAQGKGVLCLAGHLGSFEPTAAAVAWAIRPRRVSLVVKTFAPAVDRFVTELRRRAGLHTMAGRGSLPSVFAALKRNELVAVALDQHAPGRLGVPVDFFGRPAQALTALALVAARSGAPVITGFGHRCADGRHVMVLQPEIEFETRSSPKESVRHMTQVYTRLLEEAIRAHPEQWFWTHRRWKPAPQFERPSTSSRASSAEVGGP